MAKSFLKTFVSVALLGATALAPAAGVIAPASAAISIGIHINPPPPRREVPPPRPWANGVWIGGHWERPGGAWVWMPGRWDRPTGRYRSWVRGYYRPNGVWVRGHWR